LTTYSTLILKIKGAVYVNKTALKLLIALIWVIGAIVCLVKANFLMAALYLLVGIVFVVAAYKSPNKK